MIWVFNPDRGSRYRRDNSMNGFLVSGSREPDNRICHTERISEVGPIRISNFMFSTDFICEGVHSKITGKGLPILHWREYMGIFHIRRSHGVGNHDFLFS